MSIVIDLNMACLVCLQDDGGELKSIYSTPNAALNGMETDTEEPLNIAEMITQCSELMLSNVKAKLPDHICLRCLEDLMVTWRFRQNCEAANTVYRSIQQQEEDAEALANYELERQKIKLPSGLKIKRIQPEIKTYLLQLDKEKNELDDTTLKVSNKATHDEIIKEERLRGGIQNYKDAVEEKNEEFIDELEVDEDIEADAEAEAETEADPCQQQVEEYTYVQEVLYKDETQEVPDITSDKKQKRNKQQILKSKRPSSDETLVQMRVELDLAYKASEKRSPKQQIAARIQRERNSIKRNEIESYNKSISRSTRGNKANIKKEMHDESQKPAPQLEIAINSENEGKPLITKKPTIKRTHKALYNPMKICEICGNIYKYQHALTAHMRRHTNDRQFACELCEKAFVSNVELRRHMRVHTGHKPYACSFCDRRFSDFGSRSKHERTHTGERPYRCNSCNKTFAYAHVLTVHLRTHTGEKKFQCQHCGKGFTKKAYLLGHLEQHARCDRIAVNKATLLDRDPTLVSIKTEVDAAQTQQQQQELTAIKTVALEECIFTTEFIEDDENVLTETVDDAAEDETSTHCIVDLDEVEENIDEEHLEDEDSEFILGVR